jgi:hypothetical protein
LPTASNSCLLLRRIWFSQLTTVKTSGADARFLPGRHPGVLSSVAVSPTIASKALRTRSSAGKNHRTILSQAWCVRRRFPLFELALLRTQRQRSCSARACFFWKQSLLDYPGGDLSSGGGSQLVRMWSTCVVTVRSDTLLLPPEEILELAPADCRHLPVAWRFALEPGRSLRFPPLIPQVGGGRFDSQDEKVDRGGQEGG